MKIMMTVRHDFEQSLQQDISDQPLLTNRRQMSHDSTNLNRNRK